MTRSQEGAALIEFALVLPMLVLLLIGIIETGRYMAFGVRLSNAAHAGAQFGAQNYATMKDAAGIQSAACNDSGFSCAGTPAPKHTASPDTMIIASTPMCTSKASTCPDGDQYIQVSTSATFHSLLRYPIFGNSISMSAQATQQVTP